MFIKTSLGIINADHVRVVRENHDGTVIITFGDDFFVFSDPKECKKIMRAFGMLTGDVTDE